ncbi:hypothetical protein [Streptomyces sp. NPDC102437]|uniref:hypothetical protein n=1 Tax=Streptomyces sp. NPDC102437 TaxID=3366175 RepID=UPI00382778E9
MRQLSVPVRWVAVVAATVAASTGCMSIGDGGGKPAPSPSLSPEHAGSAARPDGGTVAGTGRVRGGGRAEAHSEREAAESPEPSGSAGAPAAPGDVRPGGEQGGGAEPGPGGPVPTPSASQPVPEVPEQPDPPAPSGPATPEPPETPEPEPSEASPEPSASPAAQVRNEAMGTSGVSSPLRTPDVSPQVGPV